MLVGVMTVIFATFVHESIMLTNLTSTMEIQKSTTNLVHSSHNSKVQGSVVH